MFNRGKAQPETKRKHDLSQFGIFDVPSNLGVDNDDDGMASGGDSDLEAELAAITSGGGNKKPKPPQQKPKTVIDPSELDKMVAESMRDIGSDEELSGDDDDPDLLDELTEITGDAVQTEAVPPPETVADDNGPPAKELNSPILPTTTLDTIDVIKSRIEMYRMAEKLAKDLGDNTRARSRARGLKTLESTLKQALAGKPINLDDLPPVVSVKAPSAPTSTDNAAIPTSEMTAPVSMPTSPTPDAQTASPAPSSPDPTSTPITSSVEATAATIAIDESKINLLLERQREYKMAALTAKKSGETATALQYVKIIKIFDTVLASARKGEPIDLSDMPPPPSELLTDLLKSVGEVPTGPQKQENTLQKSTEESEHEVAPSTPAPQKPAELPPPQAPKTILEALTQRFEKYKSVEANAKAEGNDRKARQTGRIVKQYQDAIRMHKAGKPVSFDELPTPPGYAPIPTGGQTSGPSAQPKPLGDSSTSSPPTAAPALTPDSSPEKASSSRPPLKKQESRISGNHSSTSVMNKTIELLLQRQKEFKEAALEAKRAGEVEQAKEYLKTFKGIDNLLNVARGGLPIDLSTLPISPKQRESLDDTFSSLSDDEGAPVSDELKDAFSRLEKQLQHQLQKCKTWSTHHKALGDVAGTNRFENLAIEVQRDLDIVKVAHRKGTKIPKFEIEVKNFHIVKCNTDLAETELEINVVRGISYNVSRPKDVDTYVKVEFPYPKETPYVTKTAVIYDTESPEYNEKFIVEIQPKARHCQQVFKRKGIKLEVFMKGGFFRSDTLIGTATVKLQPLETTCEIHESFDLMDGRKPVGGKLEVKIRIRNPVLSKQVVNESEKWLTIG